MAFYLKIVSTFSFSLFCARKPISPDKLTRLESKFLILASRNAMHHRWYSASALLTRLFIFSGVQRLSNVQFPLSINALWTFSFDPRAVGFDEVLVARASPSNRTAIVRLVVYRNAAFADSVDVSQRDSAINLLAVLVLSQRSLVVEVLRADAFVAFVVRVNLLTFTICLVFEVASRQLFNLVA